MRQRAAGRREAQRQVVKSDRRRVNDRSPVCSGFASIAEDGECRRAGSGTLSVAADSGTGQAKLTRAQARAGDAAAFIERRCPALALNPAAVHAAAGVAGAGRQRRTQLRSSIGRKRRIGAVAVVVEVGRAP